MSDATDTPPAEELAEAEVAHSRISMVWLLPALALLLGGWLLVKSIRDRGIPITLTFKTASGLEAGKTALRYRDVRVGQVESLAVGKAKDHVVVTAVIDREAEGLLGDTTQFWVVRPRATLQGVTGLGTLLSGAYIALEPGTGNAKRDDWTFEGLEEPPVLDRDVPGVRFVLEAESLGSVSVGSPLYFRGIPVGEVTKHALDDDGKGVTLEAFVQAAHRHRVLETSRFWNASGIQASAGAAGLTVDTASLEALLIGGIEFDSPDDGAPPRPAAEGTSFKLYARRRDIDLDTHGGELYVCYFEDSLRGLSVNAPVEYSGIEVGHVKAIDVVRDDDGRLLLPVTISLQPSRLALLSLRSADERRARIDKAIAEGLRATLASGSMLTGALYVEMVRDAENPPRLVGSSVSKYPEIPTRSSGLVAIEHSIESAIRKLDAILTKIEGLPLEELIENASGASAGIERFVNSKDLERVVAGAGETLEDFRPVLADLREVLRGVDTGIGKVVDTTADATAQLKDTLRQAEKTLAGIDRATGPDSQARHDLTRALEEISRAARSLRELTSYLDRHPEALLRGKADNGDR